MTTPELTPMSEFPIGGGWSRARHKSIPASSIPWDMIAPHEEQALHNHAQQNLNTLARRGGLSHSEAIAILEDRVWQQMDIDKSVEKLASMVAIWIATVKERAGWVDDKH